MAVVTAPERPAAGATAAAPAERPRRLRWLTGLPTPLIFTVSLLVAGLLLWRQGALGDVGRAVRAADPWAVLAGCLLYLGTLWLLCLRWHVLVRMAGGVSSLPAAAEAFLTSVVINYAAPIGLAVPTRAVLTKRALGLTAHQTGTVALWEIVADVLVLGTGGLLWLAVGDGALASVRQVVPFGFWSVAAVTGLAGLVVVAARLTLRRLPDVRARLATAGTTWLRAPRLRPMDALLAVGLSVGYWLTQGIVLALLLDAFGVVPEADFVLGLISLPVLVGMLSPVPGGAAVREALMVAVANVQEADAAAVLVAAIVYRLALFAAIPVLYLAVRLWMRRRPTLAKPADEGDQ